MSSAADPFDQLPDEWTWLTEEPAWWAGSRGCTWICGAKMERPEEHDHPGASVRTSWVCFSDWRGGWVVLSENDGLLDRPADHENSSAPPEVVMAVIERGRVLLPREPDLRAVAPPTVEGAREQGVADGVAYCRRRMAELIGCEPVEAFDKLRQLVAVGPKSDEHHDADVEQELARPRANFADIHERIAALRERPEPLPEVVDAVLASVDPRDMEADRWRLCCLALVMSIMLNRTPDDAERLVQRAASFAAPDATPWPSFDDGTSVAFPAIRLAQDLFRGGPK